MDQFGEEILEQSKDGIKAIIEGRKRLALADPSLVEMVANPGKINTARAAVDEYRKLMRDPNTPSVVRDMLMNETPRRRSLDFAMAQKRAVARRIANLSENGHIDNLPKFESMNVGGRFRNLKTIFGQKTQSSIFNYYKAAPQIYASRAIDFLNRDGLSRSAKIKMATWLEGQDVSKLYGARVPKSTGFDSLRKLQNSFEDKAVSVFKYEEIIDSYSELGSGSQNYLKAKAQLSRTKEALEYELGKKLPKPKRLPKGKRPPRARNIKSFAEEYELLQKSVGVRTLENGTIATTRTGLLNAKTSDAFARKQLTRQVNKSLGRIAFKSGLVIYGFSSLFKIVDSLAKTAMNVSNKFTKFAEQLSARDFGSGRALTTQMAATERAAAVKTISANKYNSRRYLGSEAKFIGM